MSRAWIGTSGWVYGDWRGKFYPAELPQPQWFAYYAQTFETVEINNSFYRLPSEAAFDAWSRQAPPGFCYAVKANRYITHVRRLIDPAQPLQRFLERVRRLGRSLGPILYQLPPRWHPNLPRLAEFAGLLPRDLLNVVEFRDPTWFIPDVYALLREQGITFCIFDMPGLASPLEVTAPAVYVRFHGAASLYAGEYPEDALRTWAERMRAWLADGHDVYVYFNNDWNAAAVRNALALRAMLS